ncbi:YbfB/YjiJ family MFS transporter [Falsiroseomonas selenitidurans]|uniref:YbfB/YjiJ family MFS transporter n=1 Tax=Falsiroseomonas selenitidurans TaxID=2716335 RepID=A0ABX1E6K5_9PROT|nr:YbfB/YjiJ family MFS transporter [Falsiroseomonas selenitidurans]NKC31407.1 YbfB/YjiJ family MFS transporter [Falsiroseomonas selenitidurans]
MSFWRPALAGAAAVLAGIGLARFAYVPLFPAMVGAGWVDGGGGGLLGAANLAGYLAGVLGGRALAARLGVRLSLDVGMALVLLSFLACALPGGLAWFVAWRGLAGLAGGLLMALTGPAVQASVAPEARGLAGGVVMAGAGSGVALVGLLVPLLLPGGLGAAWAGLGLVAGLLWLAGRPSWPNPPVVPVAASAPAVPRAVRLLLAYGLSGAGMVAPMVYLADLAVRGRGLPVAAGSLIWVLFGLGAVAGTLLGGRVAGRIGGRRALPLWLAVQVVALAAALLPWWPALLLAAPAGGFAGIGATAVTLAAAREVAGTQAGLVWVRATASYAVAQAVVAFALAALFAASGGSHAMVFGACLALSLAAFATAIARA